MAADSAKVQMNFSPRQREILLAFAQTLLPPDTGLPFKLDTDNLILPMEEFLAPFGKTGFRGLGLILLLFNFAALIFYPRLKTFLGLSPEDREKYMVGWENSRIKYRRMMLLLLKGFTCMVIFSDRAVQAQIGYDTECLVEIPQ